MMWYGIIPPDRALGAVGFVNGELTKPMPRGRSARILPWLKVHTTSGQLKIINEGAIDGAQTCPGLCSMCFTA